MSPIARRPAHAAWRALALLIVPTLALVAAPVSPASAAVPPATATLRTDGGALNAEVPTIADTAYPIPAGAYFVSPAGADTNPGTLAAPFKTVNRAVAVAPAGSTIVVRGGVYREQVGGFSKKLTIQAYPHEKPWMKGSVVTTGWVADGPRWRLNNWTTEFCRTCVDSRAIDPAYPLAGWPDMVFVDGRPLTQVDTLAKVVGNKFFVDYAANTIHIGVSPAGRVVEASKFAMAFNTLSTASGSVIRGLGFAQYAPHYNVNQNSMVRINTTNVTLADNTFAYSAHGGLVLYNAEGSVVRGNTFLYTGSTAFGAYKAHRVLFSENRVAYANQEHFGRSWAIAGIKTTTMFDVTFTDNLIEGNLSKGIWCDDSCHNVKVVRNHVRDNLDHGIFYELSSKGMIAGNIVEGNGTFGIRLDGSNQTRVYNNSLVRNWMNLSVWDNPWNNTDPAEIAMGNTWIAGQNVAYNNILSDTDAAGKSFLLVRDMSTAPFKPASVMLSADDYNGWYRSNPLRPALLIEWWETRLLAVPAPNLPTFALTTGREAHSIAVDGGPNPFFEDEANGDYRLKAGSPAIGAGTPLPADIAAAIRLPAGQPVDLGAPPLT